MSTPSKKVSGSESIGHDFCEQIVSIQGLSFAQVKVYEVLRLFSVVLSSRATVSTEDGAARDTVHSERTHFGEFVARVRFSPSKGTPCVPDKQVMATPYPQRTVCGRLTRTTSSLVA